MSSESALNEDRIETHRALVKLLEYVEEECARVGCPTARWMTAMTRSTLEGEMNCGSTLRFDNLGYPQLN